MVVLPKKRLEVTHLIKQYALGDAFKVLGKILVYQSLSKSSGPNRFNRPTTRSPDLGGRLEYLVAPESSNISVLPEI
jgi:hypothetical protein